MLEHVEQGVVPTSLPKQLQVTYETSDPDLLFMFTIASFKEEPC